MPLERITFGAPDLQPPAELGEFVMQLKTLLWSLVHDDECSPLFYSQMAPSMRDAWPDVEEKFEVYARQVRRAQVEVLAPHGLTGPQLRFKFNAVNFIASRFFEYFSRHNISLMRTWIKKLLEIIDKIFRSLLAAVPGGGAIEEYKGILESLVPDQDEEDV